MKYKVEIIEYLSRTIEVDAENEIEAIEKVTNDYNNSNIVLNENDYLETEIKILEDE